MPVSANMVLRNFGLTLFLASIFPGMTFVKVLMAQIVIELLGAG